MIIYQKGAIDLNSKNKSILKKYFVFFDKQIWSIFKEIKNKFSYRLPKNSVM